MRASAAAAAVAPPRATTRGRGGEGGGRRRPRRIPPAVDGVARRASSARRPRGSLARADATTRRRDGGGGDDDDDRAVVAVARRDDATRSPSRDDDAHSERRARDDAGGIGFVARASAARVGVVAAALVVATSAPAAVALEPATAPTAPTPYQQRLRSNAEAEPSGIGAAVAEAPTADATLDDSSSSSSGEAVDYAAAAESPVDYAAIVSDAVQAFVKPLLSEFGAAVLGFGVGAVAAGFFMGWQQSRLDAKKNRSVNRQALADLSMLDEAEIQELVGELPAWLAFRDVERAGWLNKVLAAAWPYLDQATSDVIVAALDPILQATRPSFLTTLSFERFSFGDIPARIEGVKVYETTGDGSVEIDLQVFWAGDPDVVLGVRAAQDALR